MSMLWKHESFDVSAFPMFAFLNLNESFSASKLQRRMRALGGGCLMLAKGLPLDLDLMLPEMRECSAACNALESVEQRVKQLHDPDG